MPYSTESRAPARPSFDERLVLDALEQAGGIVAILEQIAGAASLRVVTANRALANAVGRTVSELEGARADFLEDGDPKRAAQLQSAVAAGAPLQQEVVWRTSGDGELWLELHLLPAPTQAGGPRRFVLLGRDITARQRRMAADQSMQMLLAQVFQHAGVALAVLSTSGTVMMANSRFTNLCGRTAAQIEGRDLACQLHPDDYAAGLARRALQEVDGQPYELPVKVCRADGDVVPVLLRASLLERRDRKHFRIVTLIEAEGSGRGATPAEAARPEPVVLAGRVRLIGLEEVREALGERWPAMAERAMGCAENVLRRRLDPRETFSRTSDGTGFVVCFASKSAEECAFRAAGIGREIRARLIGQVEEPGVEAITAVTDPRPLSQAEIAQAESDLPQQLEQRLTERQAELERRARDRLAEAVVAARCDVQPLALPLGEAVPFVLVDLPRTTRIEIESALMTLPESNTRNFDLALLRMDALRELLVNEPDGEASRAVKWIVPIEFESFGQRARAERLLDRLRDMSQPMRQRFVPVLWNVPADAGQQRVEDALRRLRPFGRKVGIEMVNLENPCFDVSARLVGMVVTDAAEILRLHRRPGRSAEPPPAIQRLRLEGVRVIARMSTGVAGTDLAAAGVDLVVPRTA